jgi:soluble lytic murein transglycosylase
MWNFMIKKIFFTGGLLAWLLMPQNAIAPLRNDSLLSLEDMRRCAKNTIISYEEKDLLRKDNIYRIIDSVYAKINVPDYISKKYVRTIVKVESDDNPRAVSKRGARGLGQIMEDTWDDISKEDYLKNVFIPEKNIYISIKHLIGINEFCRLTHPNWNKLTNKEKIDLIAASYNGGCGRLKGKSWDIERMPEETRRYVSKIYKISKRFIPSAEIYESISARIY